ncbi:hypothetical protein CFOL_v3_13282 [Cephalotus follicularis]|uniref:RVT_2 domain-containing protein n=1 Tax=Cephalotus follicularis TaxID=3775 RepID=A0A1Q3BP31_CEPFO|nr:hypothetical protein CFOL_v3_13282 [Cephalotus follicularis]
MEKERYQRLVRRLIYLSHTRLDIAYAVGVVNQYMHDTHSSHLKAIYRILRNLKSALGQGLLFASHDHKSVEAFTNADWAGSIGDRHSTSRYCTFVGGDLVTWSNKKQAVVTRSSAEAEYRAMAQAMCELTWLQTLLTKLGIEIDRPMKLYCYSKAAISIANILSNMIAQNT